MISGADAESVISGPLEESEDEETEEDDMHRMFGTDDADSSKNPAHSHPPPHAFIAEIHNSLGTSTFDEASTSEEKSESDEEVAQPGEQGMFAIV